MEKTKTRYKVGDKVLITSEMTPGMVQSMKKYCGSIMTIASIVFDDDYTMEEDGGVWLWGSCNFVGRVVKKDMYAAGDNVIVSASPSLGMCEDMMRYCGHLMAVAIVTSRRDSPMHKVFRYRMKQDGRYWEWLSDDIVGCVEVPADPVSGSSSTRAGLLETIIITSDGDHTSATLSCSDPSGDTVSLRETSLDRDSHDKHDLYRVAKLALDKLETECVPKTEKPQLYTGKVVCVDPNDLDSIYTRGKIYSIVDGSFVCGDECVIKGIKSFDWLEKKSRASWLEVVE